MLMASLQQESPEPQHVAVLAEHATLLIQGLRAACAGDAFVGVGDLRKFWKPAVERLVNNTFVPQGGADGQLHRAFEAARFLYDQPEGINRVGSIALKAVDQSALTE